MPILPRAKNERFHHFAAEWRASMTLARRLLKFASFFFFFFFYFYKRSSPISLAPRHRKLVFTPTQGSWTFSSQILNLTTNKIIHDDCNNHIACNFFHCEAMISSLTKVMGLHSQAPFLVDFAGP